MNTCCRILFLLLVCIPSAPGQIVPMTPGQYMRGQFAGAMVQFAATIGEWSSRNEALEDEIVNARREFWATPEGPLRMDAAKTFDEALVKRDLHYVVARMLDRPGGKAPLMQLARELSGVHRVDGGISPYCYDTYKLWAEEVINAVAQRAPLEQAVRTALPRYTTYRVERDLAEYLFFNPHSILRAEDPEPRQYLAAWLLGTKYAVTPEAANAALAKIERSVSGERLRTIVSVLRSWTAVTSHLEGPWAKGPQAVLDPMVSGIPVPPTPRDWSSQRFVISQLRGYLATPAYKEAAALDRIQQLWDAGRAARDRGNLREALEERDRLLARVEQAVSRQPGTWGGDGKAVFEMVQTNLTFIDRALQGLEIDAMSRGEMNPRASMAAQQTREYLTVHSKLQPRRNSARQQTASSTGVNGAQSTATVSPAIPVPASPAPSPAPPDTEDAGPFDRAIILAQHPKAFYVSPGHLSGMLHAMAQKWLNAQYSKDPNVRRHYFGETAKEAQRFSQQLKQHLTAQWAALESHANRRNSSEARAQLTAQTEPLQAVIDELQAAVSRMEKRITAEPR